MKELTIVDLSVYTNHRIGDMYYKNMYYKNTLTQKTKTYSCGNEYVSNGTEIILCHFSNWTVEGHSHRGLTYKEPWVRELRFLTTIFRIKQPVHCRSNR